eukprot:1044142-Rhodomonas_salina.1
MCKLESKVLLDSDRGARRLGGIRARLAQLRHERCNRLRVIFCGGISNTSGEGHCELKAALQRILGSSELFGHLGMQVPLNYLLLERCMRLGNSVAVETAVETRPERSGVFSFCRPFSNWSEQAGEELAGWEMAFVSHCQQKARECGEGL